MNLANKLTISRIIIMPFFVAAIITTGMWWKIIAITCFAYASISDGIDGFLARRNDMVSDFGRFMDPLADKIFITAAFICFVAIKELHVPAWMVVVVISREFMITGLRTLAMSKGVVMPAKTSGKFKTTFQLIAIGIILLIQLLDAIQVSFWEKWLHMIPFAAMFVVTVFTVISGYQYLAEHKNLFMETEDDK